MTAHPLIRPAAALGLALLLAACGDNDSSRGDRSSVHDNGAYQGTLPRIDPAMFGIDRAEAEDIRQQMQAAVDEGTIPGALLLVGNDDGVSLLETVGRLGPDSDHPIDEQSIFRIYSMTKPVVSVAIMSMVEDGLLSLDDPLERFIPEFANLQVMDRESGEISAARGSITIEQLLTHESGIIQAIFSLQTDLGQMYRTELSGDMLLEDFAAKLGGLPVFFEPGTIWHYGHSTDILGRVLEVVDSKPLDAVLNERIFGPLGMDETVFWVDPDKAARIAQPIHGALMTDNTVPRQMLSGGGGLNSTTEDYMRFAEMLLNGGVYDGARILEEETLELMLEKHIGDAVSREFFFFGERGDWGLGFHLQPSTDDPDGPHNFGWRGIGGTLFIVDREHGFYMIYMVQKWGGPAASFSGDVATQAVYEAMRD